MIYQVLHTTLFSHSALSHNFGKLRERPGPLILRVYLGILLSLVLHVCVQAGIRYVGHCRAFFSFSYIATVIRENFVYTVGDTSSWGFVPSLCFWMLANARDFMLLPLFYFRNMRYFNVLFPSLVIILGFCGLNYSLVYNCSSFFIATSSTLFWNLFIPFFSEYCAITWWMIVACIRSQSQSFCGLRSYNYCTNCVIGSG